MVGAYVRPALSSRAKSYLAAYRRGNERAPRSNLSRREPRRGAERRHAKRSCRSRARNCRGQGRRGRHHRQHAARASARARSGTQQSRSRDCRAAAAASAPVEHDGMTWNRWYVLKSYVRSSLWIVPFVALLLEQIALHVISAVDASADWIPPWPLSTAGTLTALQTIITLTLSFIVFTFGSLIVAIQIASGQLTPRIIATTLLRDNVIRFTVGLFPMT